jgi:hypothetical protein
MGEKTKSVESKGSAALVRQPWEPCEKVGFRCVLETSKINNTLLFWPGIIRVLGSQGW